MVFIILGIVAIIFTLICEHEPTIIIKCGQEVFDFTINRNNG